MGFEEATPIQKETIPHALLGKDVIGQAQTGTGKTAAFGIPMIEQFESREKRILGLIVAPTRELAIQVAEEVNRIGSSKRIRALAIFGGQQLGRQIRALREKPHIVVADGKSTRLNSSHVAISYAVLCLIKKKSKIGRVHVRA